MRFLFKIILFNFILFPLLALRNYYTSKVKICKLICVSNLVWILKWLFNTKKNTKRICGTVINFANLPLKTNLYNLIRHSQSKICLLKLIFEHPRSIFKKLWQTSSQGGGGEGVWNYSHTFLQKMRIRTHYTRIRIRIQCGSGPIIHGSGFGFKKSLIYSPIDLLTI